MKRTLLTALFAFACLGANAQLANGSVAPDFTATDINGVSHRLYDYLEAGKTVIMDVSATWCGPCWGYHHTGALEDIYNSYGEAGSNEIVVLFIEGDPATSVSSIYGVNVASDRSVTQGDWTIGSPYPIIDDTTGSIASAYQIAFFPTVYRICPEGTTRILTQPTASAIKTSVNTGCGTLTGSEHNAKLTAADSRFCGETGSYKATITNFSGSRLTSATVVLKQGETVVATANYTGNLNTFGSAAIVFPETDYQDGGNDYSVTVTEVNGGTPLIEEISVASDLTFTTNASLESSHNITVTVHTDRYPEEMGWRITDGAGTIIHEENYTSAAANRNVTKIHEIALADGSDCYDVTLIDDYGDGWVYGSAQHGMTITSGSDLLFETDGNIGAGFTTQAVFRTTAVLGNQQPELTNLTVYPNPSTGVFSFSTPESIDVMVLDITGKTVYTATGISNGENIDLSNLQSGMYIARIKGVSGLEKIEKLIIK